MKCCTMTVKETAAYMGVHTDTIYELVRKNAMPHFRMGRKILFTKEKIEAWVKEQENTVS
ncbi:helix-turn-helix domain-containing protein [Aquibacillus kalidii]|uniref:helix-turn-helix domain-containing protein n=1 Tax=Aquibacillus kalidii TaxID=2762597 RepID=UPI001646596B|nr:helix-turn-helix domain-containing protein [Aquibacillus kalidii]